MTEIPEGFPLERDGGLADLMEEAAKPGRRFDAVVVSSPDRLASQSKDFREIMRRMAGVDLMLCVPEMPGSVNGSWAVSLADDD